MKQVAFWAIADTIIDTKQPTRVYEVIGIEQRKHGVWVQLRNLIDKSTFSAYEETLQSQNLIGYRKSNEVEV